MKLPFNFKHSRARDMPPPPPPLPVPSPPPPPSPPPASSPPPTSSPPPASSPPPPPSLPLPSPPPLLPLPPRSVPSPIQLNLPEAPKVQFRVLIIGKANAGKTTILQRVCDTTESPRIYSVDSSGRRRLVQLNPTAERGEHDIEQELIFSRHDGYVFHDSRGIEAGSEDELKIVQDFVRRKSQARKLKDRLHAIWFCVPMDSSRPSLELTHFESICLDKNVPVIAVFTKFDQFKRDTIMSLQDRKYDPRNTALLNAEMEKNFDERFLANLKGSPPIVRLERMHKPGERCFDLIQTTADALSGSVVAFMLLTIQKDNLELNINQAIKW